jgi:hypothetical protein
MSELEPQKYDKPAAIDEGFQFFETEDEPGDVSFLDAVAIALHYHRFLTVYQLAEMFGRTPASVRETMRRAVKRGVFALPPFQFLHPNFNPEEYQPLRSCYDPHYRRPKKMRAVSQAYLTKNNYPLILALTTKTAEDIAERFGLSCKGRRFNWNNKRLKDYYELPHTLQITDFLLYLGKVVAKEPGLDMAWQRDITRFSPLTLQVEYTHKGYTQAFYPQPDALFALSLIGQKPVYYVLELDRESDIYRPNILRDSSIYRKVLLYDEIQRQRIHTQRLSIPSFYRVIVTKRPGHAKKIISCIEKHARYPSMYLVCDSHTLKNKNPLDKVWRTPFGSELVALPQRPPKSTSHKKRL